MLVIFIFVVWVRWTVYLLLGGRFFKISNHMLTVLSHALTDPPTGSQEQIQTVFYYTKLRERGRENEQKKNIEM